MAMATGWERPDPDGPTAGAVGPEPGWSGTTPPPGMPTFEPAAASAFDPPPGAALPPPLLGSPAGHAGIGQPVNPFAPATSPPVPTGGGYAPRSAWTVTSVVFIALGIGGGALGFAAVVSEANRPV